MDVIKIDQNTGNPRTIELTKTEMSVEAKLERLLDQGLEPKKAIARVRLENPGIDPAFVAWLKRHAFVPAPR